MRKLLVCLIAGSLTIGSRSLYGQGLGIYHPKPSHARDKAEVEGDVYFFTRPSNMKKLADNKVLLFHTDSVVEPMRNACLLIDALQRKVSRDSARSDHTAQGVDAAALDSAENSMAAQLKAATLAYSPTGPAAHYKFLISRPGRYMLFAETKIGDHRYQFIKPLTLAGGEREQVDLDTASMTEKPYCVHP